MPKREVLFTNPEIVNGLEVTTDYVSSRHGARPVRRSTRRAADAEPPTVADVLGSVPKELLKPIYQALGRGTERILETGVRAKMSRLSAAGSRTSTMELLDRLIALGLLERTETYDSSGKVHRAYLAITNRGSQLLESIFGPIGADRIGLLIRQLEDCVAHSVRPEIASMLSRQVELARAGRTPRLDAGGGDGIVYLSRAEGSPYVKIVEFFAFLGSQPPGETWDFKAISGRLHPGQKDSVKMMEQLRYRIAAVAENELGLSLEDMGVMGIDLLYWVPFHGDLKADGESIWGAVPALATTDIRRVSHFSTTADRILLVENRTAMDYVAGLSMGNSGWLAFCTDGMPKKGLFDLLKRLGSLPSMPVVIWADWDLGGLRIADNVLRNLPAGAGEIVSHPGIVGRRVVIPKAYLGHADTRLRNMAEQIAYHGEVYQEESLAVIAGYLGRG